MNRWSISDSEYTSHCTVMYRVHYFLCIIQYRILTSNNAYWRSNDLMIYLSSYCMAFLSVAMLISISCLYLAKNIILVPHSGLCLMNWPREMLQNVPYCLSWVLTFQQYGIIRSVTPGLFIKQTPLISEEWLIMAKKPHFLCMNIVGMHDK